MNRRSDAAWRPARDFSGRASDRHELARSQRQLRAPQRAIPALTGALLVVNAHMGEQRRPAQVARGMVRRLLPGR
jgi:hypothetical protein